MSIFSDFITKIMEVFIDDFTVHGDSFDECLHHLTLVLRRCIETNLVLNFEKCHFMVDIIQSLPYPQNVREVRSFLEHVGFYRRFIKDFSKIASTLCDLLAEDASFDFNEDCNKAFDELKMKLTTTPIVQPQIGPYPLS